MAIQFKPELTIAVAVADWPVARRWYKEKLGFEESFAVEEAEWAEFTGPMGVVIGLNGLHGEPHPGAGGTTVTFGVADVEAARSELEGKGVRFNGPTEEVPGMVKLASFQDPDGNVMMLAQSLG